jgi:small subunit ribosomal protein S15
MLDKKKKDQIVKKFKAHEKDTGSTQVQIAILTAEIEELTGHLKEHKKDHSSRRGLLRKVGQRRRLLRYLQKENHDSYEDVVKKLKLKKFADEPKEEVVVVVAEETEKKVEGKEKVESEDKK